MKFCRAVPILALSGATLSAQPTGEGSLVGTVVDRTTGNPMAAAAVTLKTRVDGTTVRTGTTNPSGGFELKGIPWGDYQFTYGISGSANVETVPVTLDAQQPSANLGRLTHGADLLFKMDQVEVSARQEAFYNSIDRKVYSVGRDITSMTGSTSDLLQNVPSVDVDVEGNVSLRGDSGVQILVNGKPSAMMSGRNRSAVLEQMPADSIERIEVITNPSARYKPDGTGGIINLVLKNERRLGQAGSVRGSIGNEERYNAGLSGSLDLGKFTMQGSFSIRQDDRGRFGREERSRFDEAGNPVSSTQQDATEESRPLSRVAQLGGEYALGEDTKLAASVSFDDGRSNGRGREINITRDAAGTITRHYERVRSGPESEREFEAELRFEHAFAGGDREFAAELSHGRGRGKEEEFNTNTSLLAGIAPTSDATRQVEEETETNLSFDYVHPFSAGAKLELGYEFEAEKEDSDFRASSLDAFSNQWVVDPQTTNRFVHDSAISSLYATFGRPIGQFGFLAGLRYEHTTVKTDQVTAALKNTNDYGRVYPSLHLTYRLNDAHQLQLSYSHRVNRPDGDDLNPFPEYDDPLDRQAGNPNLVPEDTHSIEGGYQYENGGTTYLVSLYHRQRYRGITDVTRYIDANTLLTTPENLSTSRSAGLELGARRRVGENLTFNFSGNVYRNEINAANLGFERRRASFAWDAKLNTNWDATSRLAVQLTTGYRAGRLTAQGERHPSAVTNLGIRYNLKNQRTALVFTVSDLFKSAKDRTTIDTPILKGETVRRRSSQIIYLGFIYNFGKSTRESREDMQFDESI